MIFEKINLYERHSNISNQYRFEETFENYSNEKVIEIVKELGYSAKYRKKEKFFQIIETINEMKFYFHFSLEYGMVEIIMGMMNKNKKHIIGGAFSWLCKKIKVTENEEIKFKRDSNEQFLRASISTDDYLNDDKLEEIVINISNVLKKIFSSSEIKILEGMIF